MLQHQFHSAAPDVTDGGSFLSRNDDLMVAWGEHKVKTFSPKGFQ